MLQPCQEAQELFVPGDDVEKVALAMQCEVKCLASDTCTRWRLVSEPIGCELSGESKYPPFCECSQAQPPGTVPASGFKYEPFLPGVVFHSKSNHSQRDTGIGCAALCAPDPWCTAWSLDRSTSVCTFHGGSVTRAGSPGHMSGYTQPFFVLD